MRLTWHVISRTGVRKRRMLAALPTHCQGIASTGSGVFKDEWLAKVLSLVYVAL